MLSIKCFQVLKQQPNKLYFRELPFPNHHSDILGIYVSFAGVQFCFQVVSAVKQEDEVSSFFGLGGAER